MNVFDDVEKDDPKMSNVTSCGCDCCVVTHK